MKILQNVVGFVPVLVIHLTVGLDDACQSLLIQSILWILCEVKLSIDCSTRKLSLGKKAQSPQICKMFCKVLHITERS